MYGSFWIVFLSLIDMPKKGQETIKHFKIECDTHDSIKRIEEFAFDVLTEGRDAAFPAYRVSSIEKIYCDTKTMYDEWMGAFDFKLGQHGHIQPQFSWA